MDPILLILLSLILVCLLALIGWLVRIFDLLAWSVASDAAARARLDERSLKLQENMVILIERIAPGYGQKWAKKIWPPTPLTKRKPPTRKKPVVSNEPKDTH